VGAGVLQNESAANYAVFTNRIAAEFMQ